MTHLERQLRDGIRRLLEAEPNPQARAAQIRALDALLTLPNVAALLDTIDALRAQEPPSADDPNTPVKPCRNALQVLGRPTPRTCELCGLGPCRRAPECGE
jgi:hypothetical protein